MRVLKRLLLHVLIVVGVYAFMYGVLHLGIKQPERYTHEQALRDAWVLPLLYIVGA